MYAKELRIGNKVTYGLSVLTVEQIGIKASLKDEYRVIQFAEVKTAFAFIKDCEPIPLSPEILKKAGFIKTVSGKSHILINGLFDLEYSNELSLIIEGQRLPLSHITHTHQLQNLVFALTGTDLSLQL